jgi:hypothetical protein
MYREGRMVEDTLNNLIKLGKAGKVKHQPFPQDLSKLVAVCKRHARKDLGLATPWLPSDQEDWLVQEVWDKVLHTDILINRAGWAAAVDWTVNPSMVHFKADKLERVATALSRFDVDRAVVVLVHQCEDAPAVSWQAQLDNIIKMACQGDGFVSTAELYF